MLKRWIVATAFMLLAAGSSIAAYQNLRWHCWEPGGGRIGAGWFKESGWYPYMQCDSRWPVLSPPKNLHLSMLGIGVASARDLGQWENSDTATRHWFQALRQPDSGVPCCGEGDGYWAESHAEGDKMVAIIADDREDRPLGRMHVPIGTRFVVPPNKIVGKEANGNPTGHEIIFLGSQTWSMTDEQMHAERRSVLCYVLDWGL